MPTTIHPEFKALVSQFCALECCPPNIREALSSFLMTGNPDAVCSCRVSLSGSGIGLYWGDVLDYVHGFHTLCCMRAGDVPNAERNTFIPLRRMLKTIPKLHAELCHE